MNLSYLIYISSAKNSLHEGDLCNILDESRERNKELNVTGMLLYMNDSFMQVLEGRHENVNHIYEKISQDPRHHDLHHLGTYPLKERNFSDWTMGFKKVDEHTINQHAAFFELTDDVFNTCKFVQEPHIALKLLKTFYTKKSASLP